MSANKKVTTGIHYKNAEKKKKNFMYQDLKRSNCYGTDFTESNFDCASFRGAHLKGCDFYGCSFKHAEFVGTNLKKSKFREARFENVVFEGVNLDGADFRGAVFINVIFIGTDLAKASHLHFDPTQVEVYEAMPEIKISEALDAAIWSAMNNNEFVKNSRVLDTKEGKINTVSVIRLLESFDEETLIKGLKIVEEKMDKNFCILSYIMRFLENCQKQGEL